MFFEAIKYSAKSSVSRAGAWAPLPGALVVWLGLRMMGYQIAAPETLEQGIVAFLLCAGAAWFIIFVARLLYWPYRELRTARETIASLRSQESPFEIIFDPTNPRNKFWSIEQMKDENGNQIAGTFWEYRAAVRNKSARTVRNVKVTVEAIGAMPTRPVHSHFDINKKNFIDLTPNEETLAVIRTWFNPQLVQGMVIGEGAYGPIKMTASADDVLPTTTVFQFDPMQTPMIWIIDVNPNIL